jgi:hypothetical protein
MLVPWAAWGSVASIDETVDRYELSQQLVLLEDPGGQLTLEDVVVPEVAAKFVPAERNVPSLGLSDSAWWARIELENAGDVPQERLLVISRATLLHVEMFASGAQPMRFGRYFTYSERTSQPGNADREASDRGARWHLTIHGR